eukprot:TRINITY_DN3789_c0_g1_i1.p1 TRINITY_DN3789_c0_g1~~TRINITY_DN3789_c0_g1_i1.p1  ORF type:complete len:306 (+),score=39.98 TRINITY_DN3789_c0_g1_i1:53-970(+)
MLGARYKKALEVREKKAKEARVKRFVNKRSKMHWGMYELESGEQMECTYTTVNITVNHVTALVDITYRYKCSSKSAEYYFPMCEVGNLKSMSVTWKQGSASTPLEVMTGSLYEQTDDGITRPWVPENEPEQDDDETKSLLGSWFGSSPPPPKKEKEKRFFYFFGTSPGLTSLEVDRDIIVNVQYVTKCKTERAKYEDKDLIVFYQPLTIFSHSPNRWNIRFEMPDFIRRIRPRLTSQKLWADITGKRASVHLQDDYRLPLEDEAVVLLIELGEPIEPRCADPVALFIFATFIGLMLWFSLTKDLH